MQIDVRGLGIPIIAPHLDHAQRRLRFALSRYRVWVKRVVVRLGDTNGLRGGADNFCRMQVYLEHAPPVLIEDAGADLYVVIDRAAERAGRNVAKRIDRLHEKIHWARPKLFRSLPGEAFDELRN